MAQRTRSRHVSKRKPVNYSKKNRKRLTKGNRKRLTKKVHRRTKRTQKRTWRKVMTGGDIGTVVGLGLGAVLLAGLGIGTYKLGKMAAATLSDGDGRRPSAEFPATTSETRSVAQAEAAATRAKKVVQDIEGKIEAAQLRHQKDLEKAEEDNKAMIDTEKRDLAAWDEAAATLEGGEDPGPWFPAFDWEMNPDDNIDQMERKLMAGARVMMDNEGSRLELLHRQLMEKLDRDLRQATANYDAAVQEVVRLRPEEEGGQRLSLSMSPASRSSSPMRLSAPPAP